MKSLLRGKRLVTLMLLLFLAGIVVLVYKIQTEASYYITRSGNAVYGMVYDRDGDVLFDGLHGYAGYESGHFADIGTLIGDTSGQMSNTLVARNLDLLNNYNFTNGIGKDGKASVHTTLNHAANQATYKAFGKKDGTAIAYNYLTGEILICVSKPCVDVATGYENVESMPSGSLLCKAFYGTVPGSTQKVSTTLAAVESMGRERLFSMRFSCSGSYVNKNGQRINCHKATHGSQDITKAFANSCNPFFAQLIESDAFPLEDISKTYQHLGYTLNGAQKTTFSIDGLTCETASTTILNKNDFDTQWSCMGQGDTLVSPCQLMLWESAVAKGNGIVTLPHLIASATDSTGKVIRQAKTETTEQLVSDAAAQTVREIMTSNASKAYASKIPGYSLGVKSGTAQVGTNKDENSLLVGFSTDPAFPVAFCIVIEKRVSGEVTTSTIAKKMLDALSQKAK